MKPNKALAAIIGSKSLPRTEMVKLVWDYVKIKNLQGSRNRRLINADDKLKKIFEGKSKVSMLEITKYINKNIS